MQLSLEEKDYNKFLMIGDKVLIKPKNPQSQTKTGLYLPPSVQEKDKIQAGYVVKVGPGYPLPARPLIPLPRLECSLPERTG